MQEISAYLLEIQNLSPAQFAERTTEISDVIVEWLTQKGVVDSAKDAGTFDSLTENGNGRFLRERKLANQGSLEEIRLEEFSKGGQTFTTVLSVVLIDARISVYATLSVTNTVSVIAPVHIDPRCPSVIRKLLSLYSDWSLNGNPLGQGKPRRLFGEEGAQKLIEQLNSENRRLPIVVVSENDGEILWPKLDSELAFDLAGLAHVVTIDDEASWVLTEEIGKESSCYRGAVRLYWPVSRGQAGAILLPGTVWTASSLLSNDHDGKGLLRFRSTLRHKVMVVAALTIVPPSEIREIGSTAARKRLQELEQRADANSEELQLAKLYITENEQIMADLAQAKADIASLSGRAEMAEYALSQLKATETNQPPQSVESDTGSDPKAGESRFYKKTHSKPAYDVLVQVTDCGHSTWQNGAKAEKAKKGVEKLEGRSNWKSIQHCGSCTGGGMWKVRW